jgi:mRNA deadenylase 3'-5' endonuclease subunit Ccr4
MATLNITSLNLLNDGFKKNDRLKLFIDEVKKLNPDIIALQEVDLANSVDKFIMNSLESYYSRVSSRPNHWHQKEGLMLLSKYKIINH